MASLRRKTPVRSQTSVPVDENKLLLQSLTDQLKSIPPTITETRRVGTGFGTRTRTVQVPNPQYADLQARINDLQARIQQAAAPVPERQVATESVEQAVESKPAGIESLVAPEEPARTGPRISQGQWSDLRQSEEFLPTVQEEPKQVVEAAPEASLPFGPLTMEKPSSFDFVGPRAPEGISDRPSTLLGLPSLPISKAEPPALDLEALKKQLAGVGDLSGGVSFAPPSVGDIPLNVGTVESDEDIEDMSRFSRAKLDPVGKKIYDQLSQQREKLVKTIGEEGAKKLYTNAAGLSQDEAIAMMASELRDTGITDIYKVKKETGTERVPIRYGTVAGPIGESEPDREGYYYQDPRTKQVVEVSPNQIKEFQPNNTSAPGYIELPKTSYINTETGEPLKTSVGRSEWGEASGLLSDMNVAKRTFTGTGIQFTPEGVPLYYSTGFKNPSSWVQFRDTVRSLAPLAVAFIPGIGQAFTAAASSILGAGASQAAVGALSKGIASAVAGTIASGDIEKGILSGLTSGALGYGLGALQGLTEVAYIPEISASQLAEIVASPSEVAALDYGITAMDPAATATALAGMAGDPYIAEELAASLSPEAQSILADQISSVPMDFMQDVMADIPKDVLEKLPDAMSDPNIVAIQDPEVLSNVLPDVAEVIQTGGPVGVPSDELLDELGFELPTQPVAPDTNLNDLLDQSSLEDIGITETGLPSDKFDVTDIVPKDNLADISPPEISSDVLIPGDSFDITDVIPGGTETEVLPSIIQGQEPVDIADIVSGGDVTDITDVVPSDLATEDIFDITDVVPGDVEPPIISDAAEVTDITDTIPSDETFDITDAVSPEDLQDITDTVSAEDLADIVSEGATQAEEVIPDISDTLASEDTFDITDVIPEDTITDVTDAVPADAVLQDVGTEAPVLDAASDISEDVFDVTDVVPEDVEPILDQGLDTLPPDEPFDITDVVPGDEAQDITDVLSDELNAPESAIGTEISEEPFDITDVATEEPIDITDVLPEEPISDVLDVPTDEIVSEPPVLEAPADEVFDITDAVPTEPLTEALPSDLGIESDVFVPEDELADITDVVPGSSELDTGELSLEDYLNEIVGEPVLEELEVPFDITDAVSEETLTAAPESYDLSYDEVSQNMGSYDPLNDPEIQRLLSGTDTAVDEILLEPDLFDEDLGTELMQTVTYGSEPSAPDFLSDSYDVPPLPKSLEELADITDVLGSAPGDAMTPDEFLQAVESSGVGDPYIASELAGSLPSDWDLPDLSYLNTGVAQDLAAAGSDTGMLPGFETDLSYLNTNAGQEAAAAGSNTGSLAGTPMTPSEVAAALAEGAGDPYIASEMAGVDLGALDKTDLTAMNEFFKSPAGKLAYNQITSFLLNKLKGGAGAASAAGLLGGAGGIAGLGGGLGAGSPSALQFGYIPDFDITKAFSPTLYALRQRGQ